MINIRNLPFIIFTLLLCGLLCSCDKNARDLDNVDSENYETLLSHLSGKSRPNVLIISFDALRTDALGAYGNQQGASPRMDAFAEQSLVFDQAYTAGNTTPTSFASAFTGLYPFRAFKKWALVETVTLAEVFHSAGYKTAAFLNNTWPDTARNYHLGFDDFETSHIVDENEFVKLPAAWLRENHNQRIFVWIHFISPHEPYDYREMAAKFYNQDYEGRFKTTSGDFGDLYRVKGPKETARLKELYIGEVYYADFLFGKLFDLFIELGLMENSIVILTADHAEEHMEHSLLSHRQLYEEVIRIPMIIYHPEKRSAQRTSIPYLNVDLVPTFASMLQQPVPPGLDGIDLRSVHPKPRPILSVSMTDYKFCSMSLRLGDHKLIEFCPPVGPITELFDLSADPGEKNNLYAEGMEIASELAELMRELAGDAPCNVISRARAGLPSDHNLDEETVERLRSLGYVD